MKPHCKPLATALAATLQLAALAAVPLAWDVHPGQPAPVTFDRYHGEAIDFSATFRGFGELPFGPGADIRLWYQTNGMGSAWWSVPATVQSNVLSAVWSPALDPGTDRVSLFFGAPSNAYAAAVLRLRHSPGFAPGSMPDPESFHESDPVFSAWLSTYTPPDTSLEPSTNYTDRALSSFAATGTVARARSYGTLTRWTDATGCVWEVREKWSVVPETFPSEAPAGFIHPIELYAGKPIYLQPMYSPGSWWTPMCEYTPLGQGKGSVNSRSLSWSSDDAYFAITATYGLATNLVGRVALTNDIPATSDLTPATNYTDRALSSFASTGTVARAQSYGTPTRWTDANGDVWEIVSGWLVYTNGVVAGAWYAYAYNTDTGPDGNHVQLRVGPMEATQDSGYPVVESVFPDGVSPTWGDKYEATYTSDADFYGLTYGDTIRVQRGQTNLVGRVALTNDIPAETDPTVPEWAKEPSPPSYSAADVGAAPASIVPVLTSVASDAATAKLNSETALRIVLGESVWFAVTNYMRTAAGVRPSLQLWEVRDGATNLVYDSREEITNTARALTTELRAELEARIPSKAWGNYQSDGTDNPQPGEVAIVNQPTVLLTGGGTFNKYLEVGNSSVWVLTSSGLCSFGGDTNGNFFAVLDDEGKAHFKVSKTDSFDVGAICNGIFPRESQNSILCYYVSTNRQGQVYASPPVLSASTNLQETVWHEEVDGEVNSLGLTVSWERNDAISAWVATITPDAFPPALFLRAKVKQEGGVAVINTAPTRFDGDIQIGNGTYRLVPYTTGGKTYLTMEGM